MVDMSPISAYLSLTDRRKVQSQAKPGNKALEGQIGSWSKIDRS